MRIAFTTNPALGHLLPLVPLAQAARDAGHDVAIVGGASLAAVVREAGLVHVVAGPPDLPSVFARVPERDGLSGRRLAAVIWKQAFAGILAEAMAAAVLDLARSWRPDLVVHEDSEQGSWVAADALGVPYIALQATAWRGTRFRLSEEPLNRLRAAHGLGEDPGLARWHRFGFLTTRPPGLRDPADPMPVGTMGTILTGRHDAMGAILDGLEPLDLDIVAMVGHDLDPALLGPRRSTTRVVRYLPVTGLLESASLLVFHAGSGTTLAALAAGVPMVMLPVAADQPENAERCVAAGAAVALPPDARGTDEVRAAAAAVLADPAYAMAAGRLRDEIALMPPPADLVPFLESLGGS
jgi:UDP:flavonoid glycosyltransferase YjiC (YdhE family)